MILEEKIGTEIVRCQEKLHFLEQQVSAELRKPVTERDIKLLQFLHTERSIYSFALKTLSGLKDNP